MKSILKFNLDNYDDKIAHTMCMKAVDLSLIIYNLNQWLRNNYIYDGEGEQLDIPIDSAEKVRNKLIEIMEEYDLTFDSEIFS